MCLSTKNADIKNDYIHTNVDIQKCRYSQKFRYPQNVYIYRNVATKNDYIHKNVNIQ